MPLHPDFPVIEGRYQMTREWSVLLPSKFNRRIEEGDLVLWQPGMTVWVAIWNNDKNETAQQRLDWVKETGSSDATSHNEMRRDDVLYYTYRLAEPSDDRRVPALYCYAFAPASHVQMAVYFDAEADSPRAESISLSLTYAAC
jgi:hypothetical protein